MERIKVKVALLKKKLEERRAEYQTEVDKKKKEQKEVEEKYQKECEKKFQQFLINAKNYHEEALKELKKVTTPAQYFQSSANISIRPRLEDYNYYKRTPSWSAEEPNIKQIDGLLRKLELAAEETITVTDHDYYFSYI